MEKSAKPTLEEAQPSLEAMLEDLQRQGFEVAIGKNKLSGSVEVGCRKSVSKPYSWHFSDTIKGGIIKAYDHHNAPPTPEQRLDAAKELLEMANNYITTRGRFNCDEWEQGYKRFMESEGRK